MKRTLLIILISLGFRAGAVAQTNEIYLDSLKGGQLFAVMYGRLIIQPGVHLQISTQFDLNYNFPLPGTTMVLDTTNSLAVADTIVLEDTVTFLVPGTYWFRYHLYNVNFGSSKNSLKISVYVAPPITATDVHYTQTGVPSLTGGLQPYSYDAGNDTAKMYVWVSFGDSTFGMPFLVDSFPVVGSGMSSYNFHTFPSNGYMFSYMFVIKNTISSDTTPVAWMATLTTPGTPWGSALVSWTTTYDSLYYHFDVVTYLTNTTATMNISTTMTGPAFATVSAFLLGTVGITGLDGAIGNLSANTPYYVWLELSPGNISPRIQVYTQVAPVMFTVAITNTQTTTSVNEIFGVQTTSQYPGSLMVRISPDTTDVSFSGSNVFATNTQTFVAGLTNTLVNVSVLTGGQGFIPGNWYIAQSFAYNNQGQNDLSLPVVFQFLPQVTGWSETTPKELKNVWYYDYSISGTDVEEGTLQVTDIAGREVWSGKVLGEIEIPFHASPGVYIVHLGQNYKKILVR